MNLDEKLGHFLFLEAVNRYAYFDSARQRVPNCEAGNSEATRAKAGACIRSKKRRALEVCRVCVGLYD